MEKASVGMDLGEWEFLPDNPTFLDLGLESGKVLFSKEQRFNPREVIDMNYFICPTEGSCPVMERNQQGPAGMTQNPVVEKNSDDEVAQGFKDIGIVPPVILADQDVVSQVFFKKLEEDEFAGMKMDSPRSNTKGVMVKEETFSKNSVLEKEEHMAPEKKRQPCCEGFGLSIWRWRLNGIGALCSIGVAAAATICMLILGGRQRQRQQHQIQFEIYADDKRMKQVVQQATRLNQALSAVRSVPVRRAQITFGGYYDWL